MSSVRHVVLPPSRAAGEIYTTLLKAIHAHLRPKTYLEVGTESGVTLSIAQCASLAVDPAFQVRRDIIGRKPSLHIYQMTSDAFFREHDPTTILGDKVDLAFLDGMHL